MGRVGTRKIKFIRIVAISSLVKIQYAILTTTLAHNGLFHACLLFLVIF